MSKYGGLDIPALLRSVALESTFGEGDPRRMLDLQRLDYLLRQQSPEFTVAGLGEYLRGLEEGERRRLLSGYHTPREWMDPPPGG